MEQFQTLQRERSQMLEQKRSETDERTARAESDRRRQMAEKALSDRLAKEDKEEAVNRQRRIREYEKRKVMAKIERDQARVDEIKRQYDQLAAERQKLQKTADTHRTEIHRSFAKLKASPVFNKIKHHSASPESNTDGVVSELVKAGLPSDIVQMAVSAGSISPRDAGSRSRSSSPNSRSQSALDHRSGGVSGGVSHRSSVSGASGQAVSGYSHSRPQSRSAHARPTGPGLAASSSGPAIGGGRRTPYSAGSSGGGGGRFRSSPTGSGSGGGVTGFSGKSRAQGKGAGAPPPALSPSDGPVPTTRAEKVARVEALAAEQNAHLLSVLEKEQEKESEREQLYSSVSEPVEKKRLEKIFGLERARAAEAIKQLTRQHEMQLHERMTEYGLMDDAPSDGSSSSHSNNKQRPFSAGSTTSERYDLRAPVLPPAPTSAA